MPREPAAEVTIHRWSGKLFGAYAKDQRLCHAYRLREWVRIDCGLEGGALLLGGNVEGLVLRDGSATFPVRRGDRREIELLDVETFTFKFAETKGSRFCLVLSESWIAGDERPSIVAHGRSENP